jgi:hypothetical protein
MRFKPSSSQAVYQPVSQGDCVITGLSDHDFYPSAMFRQIALWINNLAWFFACVCT